MNPVGRMAVDIGNSGLRAVWIPEGLSCPLPTPLRISWRGSAAGSGVQLAPVDDRDMCWTRELEPLLLEHQAMQCWISSVQPSVLDTLTDFLSRKGNCRIEVVDFQRIPLSVEVDFPERVGVDRLLAALAAGRVTSHRPLIVIQAGSAVTVDLLDGPGSAESYEQQEKWDRFQGGAILPGVPMMLRLLSSAAELLPQVEARELVDLPSIPGKNSQAAMLAGVSSSLVGGVQHLIQRYRSQLDQRTPIVVSGGDGPLLAPFLPQPVLEANHLVLSGLRLLADLSQPKN